MKDSFFDFLINILLLCKLYFHSLRLCSTFKYTKFMRLIFDLTMVQPLDGNKFHGGGKYGEIVFKQLVHLSSKQVVGYLDPDKYLNPELLALIKTNKIPTYNSNEISLVEVARKEGNLIYSPLMGKYLFDLPKDIKIITTIHGLRTLEIPEDIYQYQYLQERSKLGTILLRYGADYLKRFTIRRFKFKKDLDFIRTIKDHPNINFITVSEHSKNSLLSFVPTLNEMDVRVFYSPSTVIHQPEIKSYIDEKYYLLVSGNRWVKNSIRAFKAFDELISERPDFTGKILVTGLEQGEFLRYQINNIDRFEFLGYVDDNVLKSLYKGAYLFVYPTLNEGFGYPPLEAMAEQCPVIASAIASVPEVCGDAVNYFNPFSVSEIKMRVLEMEDINKRKLLIQKGVSRQKLIMNKQNKDLDFLAKNILSYACEG